MTRKPFFRAFDRCWYAQIRVGAKRKQVKLKDARGEPIRGKDNLEEAFRAFYRIMAADPSELPPAAALHVANVCDLFLSHAEKHNQPRTFAWYKKYLQSFCESCGRVGSLKSSLTMSAAGLMTIPNGPAAGDARLSA